MAFGSESLSLLFRINADASGAKKELSGFRGDVSKEIAAITGEGSKLGSLISTASGVAVGIAAIGGAALAAGTAVFGLAVAASKNASVIYDMSQKMGLAAETTSSLKVAAEQSNSSIENLSTGVALFSKTVGQASRGSDEAKDKLRRLGIDPQDAINNLQGALARAFKAINDAPLGIQRTNAAVDAFGRSGANLIPTILSFHGNLDQLIANTKRLGLAINDDAAKAAKEFDRTLSTLQRQVTSLANSVGRELIPYITKEMKGLSGSLSENQKDWKEWGQDTAHAIIGVYEALKAYVAYAKYATGIGVLYQVASAVGSAASPPAPMGGPTVPPGYRLGQGGRLIKLKPGEGDTDYITGTGPAYDIDESTRADKEREAAAKKLREEVERQRKMASDLRLEVIKEERIDAKREYDKIVEDEKSTTDQRIAARQAYTDKLTALLEREKSEIKIQEKYKEQQNQRANELEKEAARLLEDSEKEKSDIRKAADDKEKERQKEEDQRWVAHLQRVAEYNSQFIDDLISDTREGMEGRFIAINEGFDKIEALEFERYRNSLEALKTAREKELITEQEFIDAVEALQYRYTRTIQEETRKRIAAHQAEFQPSPLPGFDSNARGQTPSELGASIIKDVGFAPGDPEGFSPLRKAFEDLKTFGAGVFGSLTQGFAGMIQSFLGGSKSGESAIKSLVKAITASLAVQAGVEALMQVAHAIKEFALASASAAVLDFHGAALHTAAAHGHVIAALAFGAIAGGGAAVAVALSGGQGGGSVGQASTTQQGSNNQQGSATSNQPGTTIANRTKGEVHTINIKLDLKDHVVADHFVRDFTTNGPTRVIITTDGVKV